MDKARSPTHNTIDPKPVNADETMVNVSTPSLPSTSSQIQSATVITVSDRISLNPNMFVNNAPLLQPVPRQPEEEGDLESADCPACGNPVTYETDGVCCDVCQRWFHLPCEKLDSSQLQQDQDYTCTICRFSLAAVSSPDRHIDQRRQGTDTLVQVTAIGAEDSTADLRENTNSIDSRSSHQPNSSGSSPTASCAAPSAESESNQHDTNLKKQIEADLKKLKKREDAVKAREVKVKFQEDQNNCLRTTMAKLRSTNDEQAETIRMLKLQISACRCRSNATDGTTTPQAAQPVYPQSSHNQAPCTSPDTLDSMVRAQELQQLQDRLHAVKMAQLEARIAAMEQSVQKPPPPIQPQTMFDMEQFRKLLESSLYKINQQAETITQQEKLIAQLLENDPGQRYRRQSPKPQEPHWEQRRGSRQPSEYGSETRTDKNEAKSENRHRPPGRSMKRQQSKAPDGNWRKTSRPTTEAGVTSKQPPNVPEDPFLGERNNPSIHSTRL